MKRFAMAVTMLCALLSGATAAQAQMPDPAVARAAMERLGFMVGTWRGDAWQMRGAERMQTQMIETVQRRLDGAVLLVEGRGTMSDGGQERVVHHALGVIAPDGRGGYTLTSWIQTGQSGTFVLTHTDSTVSWTREVPGGQVRNTARFTADEWHEIGEFSRDGTSWMQVMEMRLRRER